MSEQLNPMPNKNGEFTPAMRQYLKLKEEYHDAILLFRMGDFYEMFFDDAREAARVLQIALTSRDRDKEGGIPMCGVPYHAVDGYIAKLVNSGYKVAVGEQMEDPKTAKGVVKRDVVRVITPGVVLEGANLEAKENNFLLGLSVKDKIFGLALVDFSTGEFRVTEINSLARLGEEMERIKPREVVLPRSLREDPALEEILRGRGILLTPMEDHYFDLDRAYRLLKDQFQVHSLMGFGCESYPTAIRAAGAVLDYLKETQKAPLTHLTCISIYNPDQYMMLDEASFRNLEVFSSLREGDEKTSLVFLLDRTATAMGGRLLRRWLRYPLLKVEEITARLNAIEALLAARAAREELAGILKEMHDLERLHSRIAMGTAAPRDLVSLKQSLRLLPALIALVAGLEAPLLKEAEAALDPLEDAADLIERAIVPQPPFTLREGGVIREGYNPELDELLLLSREGKHWLSRLEAAEKEKTGISTLKVRYNKVFGYYIEISNAHLEKVPPEYIRKQTLTNAERYITAELKEYETKVLTAEERRVRLETEIFGQVREKIAEAGPRLTATAGALALLDVLVGLTTLAEQNNYVKPKIVNEPVVNIQDGRHPVIEELNPQERFVPNDLVMDGERERMLVITGPNMAGKSTYLRQVALIVLMAHIGSYVPASQAVIPLTDRIFTRVGAADNLVRGQSTFMVEMSETANILHNATSRSLIILDEIGRGTSTFDGLSIAWAVAEYLLDPKRIGAKTLFATHYHELTELAETKAGVKNFNVAVREWQDRIIFLRKIVEGAVSRSYGIQVARLAGLPPEVLSRAREVLEGLERSEETQISTREKTTVSPAEERRRGKQLSLFTSDMSELLLGELKRLNLDTLTPLDAINLLAAWKAKYKE